ncbi:hypothetical protein CO665_10395 [Rhizobium anhuiense]|nr:hypothetical protein CO665_10395 [Rhizobium anhuiense]
MARSSRRRRPRNSSPRPGTSARALFSDRFSGTESGKRIMPLDYGVHTFGFVWNATAAEAIARLADQGFRKFQLLASDPHFNIRDHGSTDWIALRNGIAAAGGKLVALDLPVGDYNLASPMPDVTEFAVGAYGRAIEAAAFLGSRYVTVSSGRKHALIAATPGVLEDIVADCLVRLADHAAACGIRLLFENHPIGVFPDAASIRSMLDRCGRDNIDVVYDVANARAIGEDPSVGLEMLKDRVRVIHLSDADDGKWQHAPIGSGQIDFRPILKTIEDRRFDGDVVIEIISENPLADAVASRTRLQTLL